MRLLTKSKALYLVRQSVMLLDLVLSSWIRQEITQKYPNGAKDYIDIYQDAHRRRWLVGEWTDDTDMMQKLPMPLLKIKGVNLTHIAKNFKEWASNT